jgi:ribosomal protein S27AE
MRLKMKCPKCGKRAFDISKLPQEPVEVEIKCPRCGNIVAIPCRKTYVMG